jgi:hypothetical protein
MVYKNNLIIYNLIKKIIKIKSFYSYGFTNLINDIYNKIK